eukprot:CAMPEP_0183808300 /NCGR_PEP_ID=MMETSP0803_2-20130417/43302_1 /TAXON_ID=195967 /ORGANISM="Crustomastix stigmata, Strain CCMP3273" /LENGTH=404 /DNA_ID=CAMNT_0026053091 /DNA_START=40 /DNA_END=1251 /DNA_ORIENTATION=-
MSATALRHAGGAFGIGPRGARRAAVAARATRKRANTKAAEPPPPSGDGEARQRALARVLSEIDASFGKGSIMKIGDAMSAKVETFSSGSLLLDQALGGGLPKGRIVEVYGPEASGKTTLALHAMAEVQKAGGTVAMIDAEHAFDPTYSARVGINVDDVIVCQPESGEMALEVVDQLVRSSAVDLICVDSVAALVPQAEIEGEIGMIQVGAQARLMSQALRKLATNAAKCKCTVIFINQLRMKIGVMYGNPETTSGGNALKYYSSVRLDIRRTGTIKGKGKDQGDVGINVRVKVAKNKVAPPYRMAEMDILFGSGINLLGCVIDVGREYGILETRGSHYYYEGNKLGNGRDNVLEALRADPELAAEIEQKVRTAALEATAGVPVPGEELEEHDEFEDDDGALGED